MSLFDVIKYPISDRPTIEELEALPDAIVKKWTLRLRWVSSAETLFDSIADRYIYKVDEPRIKLLRKIIKEHNESI